MERGNSQVISLMKYFKILIIILLFSCNNKLDDKQTQSLHTSKPAVVNNKPKGEIDDSGNKIGEWVYYYPSGEIKKIGFFTNGKKDGKWKGFHKTGNIRYIEEK